MTIDWERITDKTMSHFETYRTKVPGGWLVRTSEFMRYELSCAQSEALVFVPDPEHQWGAK